MIEMTVEDLGQLLAKEQARILDLVKEALYQEKNKYHGVAEDLLSSAFNISFAEARNLLEGRTNRT
jgi:hypothetical protein